MWAENFLDSDIPAGEWWWQVSEKAREKFAENLRKAQAAQKAAKAHEQKFKWYDNTLAQIIQQFLQTWDFDTIIVLIADLIEHNVPSDFILSILSIINKDALKQVNLRLQDWNLKTFDIALTFDDELKSKIYLWVNLIYTYTLIDKEKILASLINSDTWDSLPSAYLLFYEVLLRVLDEKGIEYDRNDQKLFARNFIDSMLNKIQTDILW